MTHGSTHERAEKIREAVAQLIGERKRADDTDTVNTLFELHNLEDSSLATLYNILNGVK